MIKYLNILCYLFVTILMVSCAYNSKFFQPTRIPQDAKTILSYNRSDTVLAYIGEQHYQPEFIKDDEVQELEYTIESVVFKSSSKNDLNGWMLKPKANIKSIILLHLHTGTGYLLSEFKDIEPLVKQGYTVFTFDYSGFGFSEGDATRKNVLQDANSALTYLKSREDTKGSKIILYGQSLGGHLAAAMAASRENDIDGLVVEGAFSSHKDIAAESAGIFGRILVAENYSAKKNIKKFKKPVLIIHSTEDEVIPLEHGRRLYDNANEPKEFYEIDKCHMCGPENYAEIISGKIENMVKN